MISALEEILYDLELIISDIREGLLTPEETVTELLSTVEMINKLIEGTKHANSGTL